jgi:hypothetical protein
MSTVAIWRERKQRLLNEAARCKGCGKMHFPPRPVCDGCRGREFEIRPMALSGKVLTYTVIRVAPPAFAQEVPYVVAVIEMEDATRLTAQVADVAPEEMKMGMKVRLEFRKIRSEGRTGVIVYAHKAVPA